MENKNKKNEKVKTIGDLAVLINSSFQTAKEQTDKRFDKIETYVSILKTDMIEVKDKLDEVVKKKDFEELSIRPVVK